MPCPCFVFAIFCIYVYLSIYLDIANMHSNIYVGYCEINVPFDTVLVRVWCWAVHTRTRELTSRLAIKMFILNLRVWKGEKISANPGGGETRKKNKSPWTSVLVRIPLSTVHAMTVWLRPVALCSVFIANTRPAANNTIHSLTHISHCSTLKMITISFVLLCVAQSVHATMFTTVEGGAKCSLGYESITSTWQNCKQAATWHGINKDSIVFVDNTSSETSTYPPGCYWEFKKNKVNPKGYRQFCHLAKGGIPREGDITLFSLA